MERKVYSGCTRPLKAFAIGLTANNKTQYKITNITCDHLEQDKNGKWSQVGVTDQRWPGAPTIREFIELPCGMCPNCKLNKARQWSHRCVAESFYHKSNYFLTLTYDDDNIPIGGLHESLRKKDLQDFWKRLRYYKPDEAIRYFACGEYGGRTQRPHYHALVFGLELNDLQFYKYHHGNPLFNSPFLNAVWQKGFVVVGKVSQKACNYVSRYTYKKNYEDLSKFYDEFEVEPEFTLMSRRPGIGTQFFDDHGVDLYKNQWYSYSTESGAERIYPTKFWLKKLEIDYPEFYEKVKEDAIAYLLNKKEILFKNDKRPIWDILREQEELKLKQTSAVLERSSFE